MPKFRYRWVTNHWAIAALALAILAMTGTSRSAQLTTPMRVSLNNIAVVTVAASDIQFGDVSAKGANPATTGTIAVNASSGANYSISIDGGQSPRGSGICRAMTGGVNGAAFSRYALYSDAPMLNEWGDSDTASSCPGASNGGGTSVSGSGSGVEQAIIIYARAWLSSMIGSMSDMVTITVAY